jgi:hypothetical protein
MTDYNKYSSLSKNIYDTEGDLLSLRKQVKKYKNNKFMSSDVFLAKFKIRQHYLKNEKILLINQSIYKKIRLKHTISDNDIVKLKKYITNSPLAITSKNYILVFVDEGIKNKNSQYVLMIVINSNSSKKNLKVLEIRSYYRDNVYLEIKNGIRFNETFYITKKTKKWLHRRKASLSPSVNSHVTNSIADIL